MTINNQKESTMNNSTRVDSEKRAAAARRGSIAADSAVDIRDVPDIDAITYDLRGTKKVEPLFGSEIADLPVVIRSTSRGRRVEIYRTADGGWFRQGGVVHIRPWAGEDSNNTGPRHFVITLFEGANRADLEWLRRVVEKARSGKDTQLWNAEDAPWADPQTFRMSCARAYCDPYTHSDEAPRLWFCDDANCPSTLHEVTEDHEVEEIKNDSYRLVLWRDRRGTEWLLGATIYDCGLDAKKAADLTNDIQWLQQEREKLNASTAATVSERERSDDD